MAKPRTKLHKSQLNNNRDRLFFHDVLYFKGVNYETIDSVFWCLHQKDFITSVILDSCNMKSLPLSLNYFQYLNSITFKKCDSITSFGGFAPRQTILSVCFDNCDMKQLPVGLANLPVMLKLEINLPYNSKKFDMNRELSRFAKRNNILSLYIYSNLLESFPDTVFSLTSLQLLVIRGSTTMRYPNRFNELVNLRHLGFMTNSAKDKPQESAGRNGILMHFKEFSDKTTPADGDDPDANNDNGYYQMYYQEAQYSFDFKSDVLDLVPSEAKYFGNDWITFDKRFNTIKDIEYSIGKDKLINVKTIKPSTIVISLPPSTSSYENCYAFVHYQDGTLIKKMEFTSNQIAVDLDKISIPSNKRNLFTFITVVLADKYYTISFIIYE